LDEDELSKEDQKKIQDAVQKALNADASNFKDDHLKKVEKLLGKEGYQKYEKLKNDFNNEITEDGDDPLFKI
jgi:tartrate dehydratase alpha subunit/fumarate hydratase class I-like protein